MVVDKAWGVIYSPRDGSSATEKFYLTDYKGTVSVKRNGRTSVSGHKNPLEQIRSSLLDHKLFKIKKFDPEDEDGSGEKDMDIYVEPKTSEGVVVDGVPTRKRRKIENGRCEIESGDMKFVFEAFSDVSGIEALSQVSKKYRFISVLGRGACGYVYKGLRMQDENFCAIKTSLKELGASDPGGFRAEYATMTKLQHGHLIRAYEFLALNSRHFLVTEFADGGSLHYQIERRNDDEGGGIDEPLARVIFRQLFAAVAFLHARNVIHRDVKTENVVLMTSPAKGRSDVTVKLIDFGSCCAIGDREEQKRILGTFPYMSPEMLTQYVERKLTNYTEKIDVWALGVCLFYALTGLMPYEYRSNQEVMFRRAIMAGQMNDKNDRYQKVSDDAKSLISRCLELSKEQRPSVSSLLKDKWF